MKANVLGQVEEELKGEEEEDTDVVDPIEALKAQAAAAAAEAQAKLDAMKASSASSDAADKLAAMKAQANALLAENQATIDAMDVDEKAAAEAAAAEKLKAAQAEAAKQMAEAQAKMNAMLAKAAESIPSYATGMLALHNQLRAKHGSPPTTMSSKLIEDAKRWADKLAATEQVKHAPRSERGGAGENLAYMNVMGGMTVDMIGNIMTQAWYDEESLYDYSNPGFQMPASHFTQLVWKKTTEFGAAITVSDSGQVFIVARYSPAGNAQGQFKTSVLPPQ